MRLLTLVLMSVSMLVPTHAWACGYNGGGGGVHSGSVERVDVHRTPSGTESPKGTLVDARPQTSGAGSGQGLQPLSEQETRPVPKKTESGRIFFEID